MTKNMRPVTIPQLQTLISEVGSQEKLANACGTLKQCTISTWIRRERVPNGWGQFLRLRFPKSKAWSLKPAEAEAEVKDAARA